MTIHGAMRFMSIDGRTFKVAHDGSGNKVTGGRNNEVAMNGDGSFRTIQTVMPGSFSDIQVEIDASKNDQEFLQDLANAGLAVPVVTTYADNISYTGDVVLTGELQVDQNTGLMPLAFQGGILQQM